MNRFAFMALVLAMLASACPAAANPGRTLLVVNETDATISVFCNGDMSREQMIPPRQSRSLFNFLSMGQNEVQLVAQCVNGAQGRAQYVTVSESDTIYHTLTVTPGLFGLSLMLDAPGCGIDPNDPTHSACLEYARSAVDQYLENVRKNCGYTGGRWSDDFEGHFNWCKTATTNTVDFERDARVQGLAECDTRISRREWCENYAFTAVMQFHESQELGCGFHGPRWQDDRLAHLNWCLSTNDATAQYEEEQRVLGLQQCRGE